MSQERPREKAPTRSTSTSSRTRPAPTARRYAPPPPPPRRDPFPFLMGGIIGALVVGLMVVVFLITSNNGSGGTNNSGAGVVNTPVAPVDVSGQGQLGTPAPTEQPAPRMAMDQFKALYDDPAKRPFIVDVRPKAAYDEGHIAGAVSIPEAEVDVRIAEFPKDRLIVAYCQ